MEGEEPARTRDLARADTWEGQTGFQEASSWTTRLEKMGVGAERVQEHTAHKQWQAEAVGQRIVPHLATAQQRDCWSSAGTQEGKGQR